MYEKSERAFAEGSDNEAHWYRTLADNLLREAKDLLSKYDEQARSIGETNK